MPTFPSSPSWCKAHLKKKKNIRFPRRIFILQRSPTNKKTTKKGGYVEIQMIDFRSNNPSTHGELIGFYYSLTEVNFWKFLSRTIGLDFRTKIGASKKQGKSHRICCKDRSPLIFRGKLAELFGSQYIQKMEPATSTFLFSSAVQRLGCNRTIPSVWPFG